jgi:hypothetical protein
MWEISVSVGFIIEKFDTMHSHMNVKFEKLTATPSCYFAFHYQEFTYQNFGCNNNSRQLN